MSQVEAYTEVVEFCALLQCLGYSVKSLTRSDSKVSQDGASQTVVINFQSSGLQVVLESANSSCSRKTVDSSLCQDLGAACYKQFNKESSSMLLPESYRLRLNKELQEMNQYIKQHYELNAELPKDEEMPKDEETHTVVEPPKDEKTSKDEQMPKDEETPEDEEMPKDKETLNDDTPEDEEMPEDEETAKDKETPKDDERPKDEETLKDEETPNGSDIMLDGDTLDQQKFQLSTASSARHSSLDFTATNEAHPLPLTPARIIRRRIAFCEDTSQSSTKVKENVFMRERQNRRAEISLPDLEGRTHIFRIYARSMRVESDVRFDLLARLCPNSTGAEIRSVCTKAGIFANCARSKFVSENDFLLAINKVIKFHVKFSFGTPR